MRGPASGGKSEKKKRFAASYRAPGVRSMVACFRPIYAFGEQFSLGEAASLQSRLKSDEPSWLEALPRPARALGPLVDVRGGKEDGGGSRRLGEIGDGALAPRG